MKWGRRTGLSLMELLVALAIMAVITGALATATTFGVALLDRTQRLQDENAEVALRSRLRSWLARTSTPALLVGFPVGLVGGVDRLSFTTLAPTPFAPDSAALRIEIALNADVLTIHVIAMDDDGLTLQEFTRILAKDISGFQIAYYATHTEPPGWTTEWSDTGRLPALVRITADPGSIPEWPDFTVRLAMAEPIY